MWPSRGSREDPWVWELFCVLTQDHGCDIVLYFTVVLQEVTLGKTWKKLYDSSLLFLIMASESTISNYFNVKKLI